MFLLLQLVAVFVTTSVHSQQNTGSQSQDYPTDYEYEFTYEAGGLESSSFFVLAADEGPNSTEYIELFQDIKEEVLATNIELFSRGQYVEEDLQSFSDEEAQPISEDAAEEFSLEENGGISIRVIQDTQSAGKRTAEIPPECLGEEQQNKISIEVVNGIDVQAERFPYMVSLQQRTGQGEFVHKCGGTLLSNSLILTAAHCITSRSVDQVQYDFREDQTSFNGNITISSRLFATRAPQCRHLIGQQRIRVVRHYIYPDYQGNGITGADIAILEVQRPFNYEGPFVSVWPKIPNLIEWMPNVVVGWGATNVDEFYNYQLYYNTFKYLQLGILRFMDTETCKKSVGRIFSTLPQYIDEKVICSYNQGVDGCKGDSGGPLLQLGPRFIYDQPEQDLQVGIVSWGPDYTCTGADAVPGVYTKVSTYAPWIQSIIAQRQSPLPQCKTRTIVCFEPTGMVLLSGYYNLKSSSKECCSSCAGLEGCNAWVYCFYEGGCRMTDGSIVPQGFCDLRQSNEAIKINHTEGVTVWGGYDEQATLTGQL